MTISQAQADQLLLADTLHVVSVANTLLAAVAVVQHQFDAMISLAFNIGLANRRIFWLDPELRVATIAKRAGRSSA